MADEDRERAIEAVVAPSRSRASSPRWLWILAGLIGVGCAAAFIIALVRGGDASSSGPAPAGASGGLGFPSGLALGGGVGIAIGWFAARRQGQTTQSSVTAHSSRSKP